MRLPRFKSGDPDSAAALNAILDELERLGRWTAKAPLRIADGMDGFSAELGLIPMFRHGIVGGTAIAAATSSTQMTKGSGTLAASSQTGAITDTGEVTDFWNKAPNGSIPAGALIGWRYDDAGLKVVDYWICP